MKRWFKWLGLLAAVVIAVPVLFVLSGYLLSAETELELEHRVDAPPEDLYELITTYNGIRAWWKRANEDMGEAFEVQHLGGPKAGVGMHIGFTLPGEDVFEHWTLTEVEPPLNVKMDVDFMGVAVLHRTLELTAEGQGTLVHWTETGRVESPMWRWMLMMFKGGAIENRHAVLDSAGTVAGMAR